MEEEVVVEEGEGETAGCGSMEVQAEALESTEREELLSHC